MERGAAYADIQTELFERIEGFVGIESSAIGSKEADDLIAHFEKWFASKAEPRRVFVPCVISQISAPRFEIGPITFEFIDRITMSDFNPGGDDAPHFVSLEKWMREQNADWLARVSVDGCDLKRAEEVAELSVDLAIVAFQLAAPYLDTRNMTRLDARRGAHQKHTLSETNGYHNVGWGRRDPGMAIGAGTLHDILQKAAVLFVAVGNIVRSFAAGTYRLPVLERAWCDAAYWLHEALVEPIDSIAIAKLETALEVFLRGEKTRGSEQRICEILGAFFDLEPDDPIAPGSGLNAKQFARNVVRDRSRILHGTWSTLNARGIDRSGMEGFVVTVLRSAVIELDRFAASPGVTDNIDQFLAWVRQQKRSTR
jgi:hypothetical protein